MQIISLKLVNGEEWIGRIVEQLVPSLTSIKLEKARRINLVQTNQGERLVLTPVSYGNLDVDTFTINTATVITQTEVSLEFEKQYLQEVSGILM